MSPKKLRALSLAALATVAMLVISSCDTSTIPTPTQGIRPGQPAPLPTATVATPAAQATSSRAQSSALPTATNPTQAKATATPERPVTPEQNPAGDIPDTQVFVKYVSAAGGYEFEAPEGWARTENGPSVSFVDKLDGVSMTITGTTSAPTAATARDEQVAALQKSGRAVQVTAVKDVTLPSGPAVLVDYTSNSEPNAVTGRQVRLENNAYLLYKNGKLATLTMWAPLGADNVDQWQLMAQSFSWH